MRNAIIPITNHPDQCVAYYGVQYKLSGDPGYTVLPDWYAPPPIIIYGLLDGSNYDVRITRFCCDGQVSDPLDIPISTDEPVLSAPVNFLAAGFSGGTEITWDNDPAAENYLVERDTNNSFPAPVVAYNGPYIGMISNSGLSAGTYYYRIKAQASGYADSTYSYSTATVS